MKAMSLRISMADAVALLDAEFLQAAGDAVGAIGDLLMACALRVAADDAEEELGGFVHCSCSFRLKLPTWLALMVEERAFARLEP